MGKIRKRKKWIAKPTEFSEGFKTGKNKAQRLYTEISIRGNRNTTSASFRI